MNRTTRRNKPKNMTGSMRMLRKGVRSTLHLGGCRSLAQHRRHQLDALVEAELLKPDQPLGRFSNLKPDARV